MKVKLHETNGTFKKGDIIEVNETNLQQIALRDDNDATWWFTVGPHFTEVIEDEREVVTQPEGTIVFTDQTIDKLKSINMEFK